MTTLKIMWLFCMLQKIIPPSPKAHFFLLPLSVTVAHYIIRKILHLHPPTLLSQLSFYLIFLSSLSTTAPPLTRHLLFTEPHTEATPRVSLFSPLSNQPSKSNNANKKPQSLLKPTTLVYTSFFSVSLSLSSVISQSNPYYTLKTSGPLSFFRFNKR